MNLECPSGTPRAFTPINMGLFFSVPVSSIAGSPGLSYRQPLIAGHIFSSAGVLVASELFLVIAQHLFKLDSIPVLDLPNQQIIRMPLEELQEFLRMISGNSSSTSASQNPTSPSPTSAGLSSGERGFATPLPPEAPLVVSLYVTADYSNKLFSPNLWIICPIFALPGLRGGLPMLLMGLLATIFVRSVVSPQTTGAKPLPKQGEAPNSSLTLNPEELLRFLSRFGKYFSSH